MSDSEFHLKKNIVTVLFPRAYHFHVSALKAMQPVYQLLRTPTCFRRVQQAGLYNWLVSLVLPSFKKPAFLQGYISVRTADVPLFMRCLMADIVSASVDSSDLITSVSCTFGLFLVDTMHGEFQVSVV